MISRERAIEIARARVEDEGVMSLEGRDTVAEVEVEGDVLHVYFPFSSREVRGGEPHVRVALDSGEVIDVTYTQ